MTDSDHSAALREQLLEAREQKRALCVHGATTKSFYGRRPGGIPFDVSGHHGIVSYQPTELVVTARAGTTVVELQQALAAQGQMLGFEPPDFDGRATIGGTIACGFSGPRRPFTGAARDFVLGVRVLTGRGEILSFGGQVMKNVAGYDLSRLMCGALGTLGVILDMSLRVLPLPVVERTLRVPMGYTDAILFMNRCAAQPHPLSGACCDGESVYLRLSGASAAIDASCRTLGGEVVDEGGDWWRGLRETQHDFFDPSQPLWRLSVVSSTPPISPLPGRWLVDWGGALRWLQGNGDADRIRSAAAAAGGSAMLFRGGDRDGEVFEPLSAVAARLHSRLKQALDPDGILNHGRMYPQL